MLIIIRKEPPQTVTKDIYRLLQASAVSPSAGAFVVSIV